MNISERLKKIAEHVPQNSKIVDIGTDHAYLPIYLIENNIALKVIAMDINKGPLEKAYENIKKHCMEDKIEIRLSDGLEKLHKNEIDVVIVAGMGGMLICDILNKKIDIVKNVKRCILQPQLDYEQVRKNLHKIGFKIVDEDILKEEEKYYIIITAEPGQEKYNSQREYKYGKILMKKKGEILKQYLYRQIEINSKIKNNLLNHSSETALNRLNEIINELKELKEALANI